MRQARWQNLAILSTNIVAFLAKRHFGVGPSRLRRLRRHLPSAMHCAMTTCAQRYEIIQVVISECAPKLDVVNFELSRSAALLTFPAIPFENATA